MDAVLTDATIYQRKQTLDKMTNGFGLDDAYSTTLDRIREQKGSRVKLGMEALMWVSCSQRQLKAGELCQALGVKLGNTDLNIDNVPSMRTLLSCTLGLVAIDEQSSIVRLVHFTLQEYLAAHPNLFITPHSMMAEICLTYLNFQSVCELSTSIDTVPLEMPFLRYASCYWGFHARKEIGGNVVCLALQLLRQDATHIWVDILLREESVEFLSWGDRYCGRSPDLRGFTGLHGIAYMGIAQVAVAMMDMKIWDLNGGDSKGETPLIWASKYGNFTLTKLLLQQQGVDPTLSDKQGLTPLMHAAMTGHQDVVKLLLGHRDVNPNSSDKSGRTPLSHAVRSKHENMVKLLLAHQGVNPDSRDKDGLTPLLDAAGAGGEGIVRLLLQRGDVNPNLTDHLGQTPLVRAIEYWHEGIVGLLLERDDVNPNLPDMYGTTPLLSAVQNGELGIMELLLDRADADPNSSHEDDVMTLLYAARTEDVMELLLERVDVDLGGCGQEILAYAAKSRCEDLVKLLLKRGCLDPNWSDDMGRTQLSYAAEGDVRALCGGYSSSRGILTPIRRISMAGHQCRMLPSLDLRAS